MNDTTFFLLREVLPLGIASIAFFTLGLGFAKLIWGRFQSRLTFAVDENINLASQWSALGETQRDLFKRLHYKWHEDREAWEVKLEASSETIEEKERIIADLADGKDIDLTFDSDRLKAANEEIGKLERRLEESQAALLEAQQAGPAQTDSVALAASGDSVQIEAQRAEIEKLQSELESLRAQTESEKAELVLGAEVEIENLQRALEEAHTVTTADTDSIDLAVTRADQFSAIAAQRARETEKLRVALREVEASPAGLAEAEEQLAAAEKRSEELAGNLSELAIERESVEAERDQIREQLNALKLESDSARLELDRANAIKQGYKDELNDVHHELYDVRRALNERLDEIELLESGLDEWVLAEEQRDEYLNRAEQSEAELGKIRASHSETLQVLTNAASASEELEALLADRNAEIEDLSAEVRQKSQELRQLKESHASQSGETEALVEQNAALEQQIASREQFTADQEARILDLEKVLGELQAEGNAIRVHFDQLDQRANEEADRAAQIESEWQRRLAEFESGDARVATAEQEQARLAGELERVRAEIEASESRIGELEGELESVIRERNEQLSAFETAQQRISTLEDSVRTREEEVSQLTFSLREMEATDGNHLATIARLEKEIAEALNSQTDSEREIEEIRSSLSDSDGRAVELAKQLSERDYEVSRLEGELAEVTKLSAESANDEVGSEIANLEGRLSRKGETIQKLQSELSQAMTDSAHRDEEIRMLTEKLRALESQLDEVRSSQRPGDDLPAQAALSDAIRASLEEEKADERQSLDELPEAAAPSTEDHHQPQGIETDRDVEAATHRHRSVSPALAESEDHVVIYFDDRSDELEIGEVEKVDQLAKRLRQEPGRFQVIISGFALAEGTPDFNELISSKRADAVRERLATRGVTQAGVSVRAMGQDRRHSDWKARRVEVHLQPIGVAESIN